MEFKQFLLVLINKQELKSISEYQIKFNSIYFYKNRRTLVRSVKNETKFPFISFC